MVSEAFRKLEDHQGDTVRLQDDVIEEIAHKIKKEKHIIEMLVYKTCVTTNQIPFGIAVIVNEFLVHLDELEKEVK